MDIQNFANVALLKAQITNIITDLMCLRTALEGGNGFELYKALVNVECRADDLNGLIGAKNTDIVEAVTGQDYMVAAVEYDIRTGGIDSDIPADIETIRKNNPAEADRLTRLLAEVKR